jgi:hypothetical protein
MDNKLFRNLLITDISFLAETFLIFRRSQCDTLDDWLAVDDLLEGDDARLFNRLIAQELNQDNKPIFGSYVVGNRWTFTTLIGRHYCASQEYNAANKNDLLQIVFILKKLKILILNR